MFNKVYGKFYEKILNFLSENVSENVLTILLFVTSQTPNGSHRVVRNVSLNRTN